ncbi:MAG: WPE palindromic element domain-containing protein [Wolbachia sp.]
MYKENWIPVSSTGMTSSLVDSNHNIRIVSTDHFCFNICDAPEQIQLFYYQEDAVNRLV